MQVELRLLGIGLYDAHHYRRKNFHFLFDSGFVTGYIIGMKSDDVFRLPFGACIAITDYLTFELAFRSLLVILHLLPIQIIEVQPMSFKLNINILADTDNSTNGREQYNPLLRTTRNHIRRPRLEGYITAIRKGEYSWARLAILQKSLPRTAASARASGDVWTAYWADSVLACIEMHGHKVQRKADK
jgi:hypothetical protein